MHRQHLEAWVYTRVPALGHRTPRQVVRTVRGRERVEALLAGFDGSHADARPARRDTWSALRRTLGLNPLATRE
ncbi:MAG: antitoxin Xre/MbcA/ParS toxin-binding domain-containing protein [Vicinamibacterales bacterium]